MHNLQVKLTIISAVFFSTRMPGWPHQLSPVEELESEKLSYNKRNILKWEKDEPLGENATISAVLYANTNYPDLKMQYPGSYLIL